MSVIAQLIILILGIILTTRYVSAKEPRHKRKEFVPEEQYTPFRLLSEGSEESAEGECVEDHPIPAFFPSMKAHEPIKTAPESFYEPVRGRVSARGYTAQDLRSMVIAREILDKPVSRRPRGYGAVR